MFNNRSTVKVAGKTSLNSRRTLPAAGSYIQPCVYMYNYVVAKVKIQYNTIQTLLTHPEEGFSLSIIINLQDNTSKR